MSGWEDLRKQARKLENEIDLKLVSFSKLGTSFTPAVYRNENSDTEPLLSSEDMLSNMAQEIEQLLSKLTSINDKLTEYSDNNEHVGSSAMRHVLQRHHDILQDYTQEFRKTSANLKARKEREDLLHSVRKDIDSYKNTSGLNRRMDLYMRENEHIRNSDRIVSDQINIAMETREHLVSQRHHFKRIQTRIHDLSSRFPMINNLMQKIHFRKKRDSVIVGLVAAVCVFFILLYTFH
ncbi:Golgi SNAP receptor complex member 1 [Planococcus citri]|uniref:Golgi SNAP receptor complex member 1 n=1 Tax=Planococcus citri TaxID=170843 RepID=UPI0031F9590A